jgi:predicted O-methyltransferase YrrM
LRTTFEDTLRLVAGIEGWLTDDQARRLWETAGRLKPLAKVVEIGSYHGRSAIVMASAAPEGVEIVAIDPHAGNDRGPRQIHGTADEGEADHRAFRSNLERAGLAARIRHVRLPSADAGPAVGGAVDVLYVDGAHRYRPTDDDLVQWGARVAPGGTLLVHDSFSSVGVTLALMRVTVLGRGWSWRGREGSLAEYRKEELRGLARLTNGLRQAAQLPWFARNLLIKLLLVARLRRAARLLGHRTGPWPY